ncbi:MAG TPA: type III pantothenate kinase [Candidatus Limivivens merdigallinarum]|uniref:Type III pantothenate kinase n=1 Tax=Candidatus Limivivens merdigallinarum TaxID=2840859 RepID=A0A9D1D2A2_9FIRM|nr:type III pantothenate kinase [Candidatus Limivivens merdigallinarum]
MILAIDIGNTNIVIGCIRDEKILFVERMSTDNDKTVLEYAIGFKTVLELYHIQPKELTGSIISSVVPPVTNTVKEAIQKITSHNVMVVGPGLRTGLNILMDDPGTTGSDLIVNAVAAIAEYKPPLIIFDLGTATTVSVVDQKKNYIGGMILPGINVSLDGLISHTSQLRKISIESPKKVIGTNTSDCMKSGVIYGNAACMDGIVERIEEELGEKATVLATGGLASLVTSYCRKEIILDDTLLLKGLRLIYLKNCDKQ